MGIIKFSENHRESLKRWESDKDIRLQELGDKAFPLRLESSDDEFISFTSNINGKLYEFDFSLFKGDATYTFGIFDNTDEDILDHLVATYDLPEDILFYDSAFFLVDEKQRSTKVTGTGDAPFVFATAQAAYSQFFRKIDNKFDVLHFSAKEESRRKLYDFFLRVLGRKTGWATESYTDHVAKHYLVINPENFGKGFESDEQGWVV